MSAGSPPERDLPAIERLVGPLEASVLRSLWAAGEATAGDVVRMLEVSGRTLAHNTVLTTLTRLHAKGLVLRRKNGKRHVYRAVADEGATLQILGRVAVDALIQRHGTAALAAFAEHFDRLTPAEREALGRIAESER